jgi:hypothetical protein
VRNGFSDIRSPTRSTPTPPTADIEALVSQSQKRSAVYDIVTNPTTVTVEVGVNHGPARPGRCTRRSVTPRPLPSGRWASSTTTSWPCGRPTDIVGVITKYTPSSPLGQRWVGLCPFHGEKTPSFSVNQDVGLYGCLGLPGAAAT